MLLLSAPFDGGRPSAAALPRTAILQALAATLVLMAIGLAIEVRGGALAPLGRSLMGAAVHGGFLAMGCVLLYEGRPGWRGPAIRLAAVLVPASLLSRVSMWGPAAYLILPIALLAEGRREPEVAMAGLTWPRLSSVALGLAAGAFLGVHLLIAASLTLGYVVRIDAMSDYLAAVAYDVGVSALTAEWLLRGALFSRWWRQWPFGLAAGLSTACAVIRYVLDPNLPNTVDARLGAVFYMGLLGFGACALRAWSGSLIPGYLTTVAFFLAYRTLSN